jgi:FHS family L-fucose permease-like MFS transporter
LLLGAGAIFFYVGAEVSIGNMLIEFLQQSKMGGYNKDEAKWFISIYFMMSMIGRFLGFLGLQKVKAERGLIFVSIMAVYFVIICMFTSGAVSRTSIIMLGLCNSIMWPCIFPLSLSGLGKYTSQGSGLLVTMVFGGAVIPLLQAYLAENVIGFNMSFIVVLACYIYILYFALVGHKWAKESESEVHE